jgi:glutamyl-tRNA synthetase
MNHNSSQNHTVVTRFAPSPTGFMHIGGVRTALFAYLYAKKMKGTFILRIEDTDKEREIVGSVDHIQESLRWLGITWDYGPENAGPYGSCIQSERLPIYLKYARQLIEKGLAYPDPYTPTEVAAFKEAAIANNRPFLIREHRPEVFETWDGTKPLRLKVPEIKRYTWTDVTRGELSAGPESLDDVVLIKSDGYPTYNFAHIIDDLEMGVTHIMRADEFISSMPKFLSIYDALGIPYPRFVTLPPILRDDRTRKLGKRDGAKDILEYRTEGYLPSAMMNFLALTGWNPGTEQEVFTPEELINTFDISKIQRAGAVFNEDKLIWMNRQHLSLLSPSEFSGYITPTLTEAFVTAPQFNSETVIRLISTIRERINTLTEFKTEIENGEYDFAFISPVFDISILQWKNDESLTQVKPRLEQALELLKSADWSKPSSIKEALWSYAEEVGKGELLWPLRVCLSGKIKSPDPFTLAYIIGQVETLSRIKDVCNKIGEK